MEKLGETIRKLRLEKKLTLRTVATFLNIDQAILSKIETGKRRATREQVVKFSTYFKIKEKDLLVIWLSDKFVYEAEDEQVGLKALQIAEDKVNYQALSKISIASIITNIKKVLKNDGRVSSAWLFGSIITKEYSPESDLDIIIELNDKKKYSMFDLLDIAFVIEKKINRKVDLVEKGQLKDFAMKTANHHLQKIYG